MIWHNTLPLLIILSAMLPGIAVFFLKDHQDPLRRALNFFGSLCCLSLILILIYNVYQGQVFETRLPLLPNIDLVFHADALSLLFVTLSGVLWLLTTIYATGYFENTPNQSRFFGFFSLCVSATIGLALAGNLITFLIFYELLTLTTYPLVVHKGNQASLEAGRKYLVYTMIGGALLLGGVVWLKSIAGPLDFTSTGVLANLPGLDPTHLKIIFALLIIGLGVKAALVPLHGWLPAAMAAPAPVSSLLHAVAVVKAGAFGIVRVVYDVYGVEFAQQLGVTVLLAILASFTIIYGSVRALFQTDLKKRLAFSTVSQVSYIALGTAIAGPIATIGGVAHLFHQGLMKITMFFCAGNLAETLGVHKISQLDGCGRRMPLTMGAFSLAVLGMIGIPPAAGFVSKWYLGTGALEVELYWVLGVLVVSSLLNAMYFLPILYAAWFKPQKEPWPKERSPSRYETHWMLLLPPVITASLALAAGLFADANFSPIHWVKLIAANEYGETFIHVFQTSIQDIPLLWLSIVLPLIFAFSLVFHQSQKYAAYFIPIAGIVAFISWAITPYGVSVTPWLFFGSVMAFESTSATFFLLAATLWTFVGIFSIQYLKTDPRKVSFFFYLLLAMSGNFGLILANDIAGFISFFTLMSLASYGLILHPNTQHAHDAGKSYMQWAIFGELLLFTALAGLYHSSTGEILGTPSQPSWVTFLLFVGFGIKAGVFSLHVWLPIAHPVAPIPASALLSGIMVKAGLLGWMKFIPFGETTSPTLGLMMIFLGFLGTFAGVLIGCTQKNPKTLLAYSTVSQMGVISVAIGTSIYTPELWPLIGPAIILYAVHHGLAKAALFLSVSFSNLLSNTKLNIILWIGIAIPAVSLAGLPLTSGAYAKLALKAALVDHEWIAMLITISAIGTSWLMMRFLYLLHQARQHETSQPHLLSLIAYFGIVAVSMILIYTVPQAHMLHLELTSLSQIWQACWPMLIGGTVFFISQKLFSTMQPVCAGDLIYIYQRIVHASRVFIVYWVELVKRLIHKIKSIQVQNDQYVDFVTLKPLVSSHLELSHPGIIFVFILFLVTTLIGVPFMFST
ncbi:complex I subunit 5 family protein [Algicola sagamiensis]|uniref:complex I subunit 5 family protein n=1 Tax=Algicola sagamiensis TaxID=163869 RepID=UPI00037D174F|nr:proton-conducting transporter membrane subunit [Algicola sagamiensis]